MKNRTKYILVVFLFFFSYNLNLFSQDNQSIIKKMSKEADVILTGKVVNHDSKWNEDRSKIYTDVTVQVTDLIKGAENNEKIVVRYAGGEVGDVGELYTHMPKFEMEEEVLLFAKLGQENQPYKVLAGESGKITLFRNQSTGSLLTAQNIEITEITKNIQNYISE